MPSALTRRLALSLALTTSLVWLPGNAGADALNGGFETGDLAGWTVRDLGSGAFLPYQGTASPINGLPISAPPEGAWAVATDQGGPGSHILYQDVALAAGSSHTLSFTLYYTNRAGAFATPATLSFSQGSNQQYRVDVLDPVAAEDTVTDGVLANVFQTQVGDPATLSPTVITFDLTPYAGQTVRLRWAEVDNMGVFNASFDDVSIDSAPLDDDGDGVLNDTDNCPVITNPGQEDTDGDGSGDACDAFPNDPDNDADGDGIGADTDNCPVITNPGQEDTDGDGPGDVCDPFPNDPDNDADGDGIGADTDNCPVITNPGQEDTDGDGPGDVCDPFPNDPDNDADGDGIGADTDNCLALSNPGQDDADGDGTGDPCDTFPNDPDNDADGDGIGADIDACPGTPLGEKPNTDGCSSSQRPGGTPAPMRTLTVVSSGDGNGSITGPGIDCPGDCTQTYSYGAKVTLVGTATLGSAFTGWSEGCSGATTCELTMTADRAVTGSFARAAEPDPEATPKQVTLSSSRSKARPGRTIRFTVTVAPCEGHAGEFVHLETGARSRTGSIDSSCQAIFTVKMKKHAMTFQAISPQQYTEYLDATSLPVTVKVKKPKES